MSSAIDQPVGIRSSVTSATATTLPPAWYADDAHHRAEASRIFGQGWSCVGALDDVGEGGFLATTAGSIPVVVTRSADDGRLRAFLNVCRHRGAPVADGCGSARVLRCPYHSWSYRLDGALATWSGMDDAEDFEPADFGLTEIAVATWFRFVFVCPDPEPPPFDLGPLASAVAPYQARPLEVGARKTVERAFNWKLLVENYSENFHTPFVHPQLTWQRWEYPIVAEGSISLAWDRPTMPSNPVEQALADCTPLEDGWAGVAVEQIDEVFLSGVYFTVFPNLLVSAFPRYVNAFWLQPLAANRTAVHYVRLWAPEVDDERRRSDLVASEDVAAQDLDICEAMQRVFDGGADPRGRLSPEHEAGVFHVHQLVRAANAPVASPA
jgi:Rieske 2Fe-2S family protein